MTTTGLVLSHRLSYEEGRWYYRGDRPTSDAVRHGFTNKTLTVLHGRRLFQIEVSKQRWLWPDGHTSHDRPAEDVGWSRYGLLVAFASVWAWLSSPGGLAHVSWPWEDDERPSRRSVQRWLACLLEDALAWQAAIRSTVVDALAPRLIDEWFPAGLPPPGCIRRFIKEGPRVGRLATGLHLMADCRLHAHCNPSAVFAEARRRFERSRHR